MLMARGVKGSWIWEILKVESQMDLRWVVGEKKEQPGMIPRI